MLDIVFDVPFFKYVSTIEGLKLIQRTKIFYYKYLYSTNNNELVYGRWRHPLAYQSRYTLLRLSAKYMSHFLGRKD